MECLHSQMTLHCRRSPGACRGRRRRLFIVMIVVVVPVIPLPLPLIVIPAGRMRWHRLRAEIFDRCPGLPGLSIAECGLAANINADSDLVNDVECCLSTRFIHLCHGEEPLNRPPVDRMIFEHIVPHLDRVTIVSRPCRIVARPTLLYKRRPWRLHRCR